MRINDEFTDLLITKNTIDFTTDLMSEFIFALCTNSRKYNSNGYWLDILNSDYWSYTEQSKIGDEELSYIKKEILKTLDKLIEEEVIIDYNFDQDTDVFFNQKEGLLEINVGLTKAKNNLEEEKIKIIL